jgi:hypothetical protein
VEQVVSLIPKKLVLNIHKLVVKIDFNIGKSIKKFGKENFTFGKISIKNRFQ